ncbi:hypothetical protein DAPPUDRAFT_329298 [Daphnia pulex]|uniref:AAA+ ATPase domain-containing protein n=1 Tax=Daphnia pulex TaxID=6669 RepID=E9HG74_DAPPU|nr:hypothetical protein DAPPUDRAFT_329298 [Daphnia pulex]|eukprot:EFX69276.1 hypothetical protein DAPPUDRAFT_329298 [Daphnia pulex]
MLNSSNRPIVSCHAKTLLYNVNCPWHTTMVNGMMGIIRDMKQLFAYTLVVQNCLKALPGWTPLHIAASQGNVHVIKVLLKCGANPNLGHDINNHLILSGCTALHYACIIDDAACVAALLNAGANPSLTNHCGKKPFDCTNSYATRKLLYENMAEKRGVENRRKYPFDFWLKGKIIGQKAAIDTVASTIRRKENGWVDEERPLVFLFLGSSGIGKTEIAKQVANYLNPKDSEAFIRLDMSEYQHKNEVSKIIGSPPGYVGFKESGQLTKKLEKCPYAVVLLDEVDKAHPDILSVLLQLFDEGRITNGKGQTIFCKDAIFIMTSNLANDEITNHAEQQRRLKVEVASKQRTQNDEEVNMPTISISISREFDEFIIRPILKRHFGRDEFLGRINEIVYFQPFSSDEIHQLVKKELDFLAKKAKDRYDVNLSWDEQVLKELGLGYKVAYGARSIKYEADRKAASLLSNFQELHGFQRGAMLQLYIENSGNGPSTDESPFPRQIHLRIKNKDSVEFTAVSSSVQHLPPTAVSQRTDPIIDQYVLIYS